MSPEDERLIQFCRDQLADIEYPVFGRSTVKRLLDLILMCQQGDA